MVMSDSLAHARQAVQPTRRSTLPTSWSSSTNNQQRRQAASNFDRFPAQHQHQKTRLPHCLPECPTPVRPVRGNLSCSASFVPLCRRSAVRQTDRRAHQCRRRPRAPALHPRHPRSHAAFVEKFSNIFEKNFFLTYASIFKNFSH